GQCARAREVHVSESPSRLHARHAGARAVRARRSNVQLGLHPARASARARGAPAGRDRALGPRRDRRRARDGRAAHNHAAASADGAPDLRDRRARGRRALSLVGRLQTGCAGAARARGAVRVRASRRIRRGAERVLRERHVRNMEDAYDEAVLLAECRARAIDLLKRNSTAAGVLAAAPGPRAERRGYTAVFGRDAAICALGMAVSGDPELERSAAAGLETLAAHQAPNGQLPKFVDVDGREADFWYLGCIDSTLWWLIAVEYLDRTGAAPGLLRRLRRP